jgi:hypothetical protein
MTEPTPAVPVVPAQEPAAPATPAPPWGSAENFDAGKAWSLIEGLRADKERLSARPALTEQQQTQLNEYNALVEASKTEAQRTQEALAATQRERDDAAAEALRLRIAVRHGITEDDFDLLGSGTPEQVEARAQKIAAKNAAAAQALTPPTVVVPPVPTARRPAEQLPGGATPSPDPVQADDSYPADWLSPTQRARVQARTQTT